MAFTSRAAPGERKESSRRSRRICRFPSSMPSGLLFEKLFLTLSPNGANARFEAQKFGWIGSALRSTYVTITWRDSPVRSFQDALVREAVLGASTTSSDNYLLAILGNRL